MPKAPTSAPPAVTELVEHFQRNLDQYRSLQYKEAEVRREFIDPFFEALGWDMQNRRKYAEAYKDVVHEPSLDEEGTPSRAPDYSFQPAGHIKFFVEAKKPSVNLDENHSPALQLRRYGWTQQLPISILTNFAEFAVYDCRMEPGPADGASTARVLYRTFDEYAEHWDELVGLFSPDAVFKGSFDRYAETRKRKGVAPFDQRFLDDMEAWRKRLAENLALRNHGLSQAELNYAVQQTIDRILFLRICEARGIEPPERLRDVAKLPDVYPNLVQHFRRADDEYNSGLFHFHSERGRLQPDELTPNLKLDDEVLRAVIGQLYWPARPYAFEVVPADILGHVYERFLGKVIRLTAGHHAKVEEKPEVKKAGGVYYTPTYIVEYIVKNTVGKLLEGKTPKQVSKLHILDPACGSGSFLLGAYDFLLKWYLHAYIEDGPEKHKDRLYPVGSSWKLTIGEKKQILLNNIHGVDIDSQAVEVTKLSLLLKVLEGESEQTAKPRLIKEPALPDLDQNIKCGNSLIAPDFYEDSAVARLDEETRRRTNPFDWKSGFPEIVRDGSFDAVIGNPPYGALLTESEETYLRKQFSASTRDLDTYALFMEQALRLCSAGGKVAMIVPTGWYSGLKFSALRRLIATHTDPESLINLPYDVFAAWVDTTVFVVSKKVAPTPWPRLTGPSVKLRTFPKRHRIASWQEIAKDQVEVDFVQWFAGGNDEFLTYADTTTTTLIRKIQSQGRPFSEFADIQRGVTPFILTDSKTASSSRRAFDGTIRRYTFNPGPRKYIRFDKTIAEPKPDRYFRGPRLLLRELISRQFRLQATRAGDDFVTNKSMQSILRIPKGPDLNYLLACLNSRLVSWYFLHRSNVAQRDDFPKIVLKETRSLPIPPWNENTARKETHDHLVQLVDRILDLQEKAALAKTDHERTALQRQIDATDRQIDQLVYQLYGLTEDEIALVESAQAANAH